MVLGPRGRCAWELPPRARRIRLRLLSLLHGLGTTSACAENTLGKSYPEAPHGNYLRVRGEYILDMTCGARLMELPPRARRIRNDDLVDGAPGGTTSACAENTFSPPSSGIDCGNYLRVRGEYGQPPTIRLTFMELPPRARRILHSANYTEVLGGTTSACAENTAISIRISLNQWNYLRVRGEYIKEQERFVIVVELPPRARRIRITKSRTPAITGTTSACAENTVPCGGCHGCGWNYLRVRGEYTRGIVQRATQSELPPRARRILSDSSDQPRGLGTTSACAENTGDSFSYRRTIGNYLRVRGEYLATAP